MILLVGLLVGVIVGWIRGGSVEGLGRARLANERLLFALLLLYLSLPLLADLLVLPQLVVRGVWFGCLGALAVVAARNIASPGLVLVWVGILLNYAVVSLNGGMPVGVTATTAASGLAGDAVLELLDLDPIRHAATGATVVPFLGDVIPLPLPSPVGAVLSVGDVLLSAGVGWFVSATMVKDASDSQ
ncbi:MAG: hypothetical protein Kow0067_03070 [Coriobacteriia bacterium]